MKTIRIPMALALALFTMACVTINVYFPAEAAEKAADRIIKDVYGDESGKVPAAEPDAGPQSWNRFEVLPVQQGNLLLDWLIAPAHASADLSLDSPAIRNLKAEMEQRHQQLKSYYSSGAVGITDAGELQIRDQKLVPLKDRNTVKSLVAQENRDRAALYAEIARANSHPEWEAEIRTTFARRWIDNAHGGWWYMDKAGGWKQK